ncbi:MAG: TlpA disulfide reductase family protein [Candidatus Binataceae bacterium]|jgi:peroxiredoxin
MRSKVVAGIGVVLIVVGLVAVGLQRLKPHGAGSGATAPGEEVAAGELAANFNLQDLDGHHVTLESLRGKVVFLNVWATWCGPCREEMPSMETLFNKYKNRKDFVMLAISQDQMGRDVVAPYVQKYGYHFEVLLDPDNRIGDAYGITGVPETFIIDRKGRIVAHHMGSFDWSRDEVSAAIDELLKSKQG